MVCRSVQVERPRVSTSGGQSGGRVAGVEVVVVAGGRVEEDEERGLDFCLIMAAQSATEVQERQLEREGNQQ